jgi:hypothetical protein
VSHGNTGDTGDTGDYPPEEVAQMAHSLCCQGDHHPVTVREMQRTPRGGVWYAKSVSNLFARA